MFKFGLIIISGLLGTGSLCADKVTPTEELEIIDRLGWNARPPNKLPENLTVNPPPFVVIHHSAGSECTSRDLCQAQVKSIQNSHVDHNHWNDIGYNFLVGEDGNVYEGRGWNVKGAHSPKYNAKGLGICIMGNFEKKLPRKEAIDVTKGLLAYGVSHGYIAENYTLLGHRQTKATICPGDKLYELIKNWPQWKEV